MRYLDYQFVVHRGPEVPDAGSRPHRPHHRGTFIRSQQSTRIRPGGFHKAQHCGPSRGRIPPSGRTRGGLPVEEVGWGLMNHEARSRSETRRRPRSAPLPGASPPNARRSFALGLALAGSAPALPRSSFAPPSHRHGWLRLGLGPRPLAGPLGLLALALCSQWPRLPRCPHRARTSLYRLARAHRRLG